MPPRFRTVGLDFGGARCGVAIDDELGRIAHPRPNVPARDRALLIEELVAMAKRDGVGRFVVGLPLEMSGREGRAAEKVRTFAQLLADAADVEVVLFDERLTTVEAARNLRQTGHTALTSKDIIDAAAAVTILQAFLDARRAARKRRSET